MKENCFQASELKSYSELSHHIIFLCYTHENIISTMLLHIPYCHIGKQTHTYVCLSKEGLGFLI